MVYRQLYHIGHSINKQVCKATNLTYYTPRAEKTSTYKIMHLTQNTKGYASLNISGEGGTPLYAKLTCAAEQGMFFRVSSLYNFSGGGATPLYKPYKYVPPLRVGFLRRFGLKTGISWFCPFWSGSGYGFTKELRLRINVFVVSIPNE